MRNRRKSSGCGENLRSLRVVILGQDGVGKSALTVRLLTKRFIGEYDRTLESAYRHHFEVENELVPLDVLDTAGRNTNRKLAICAESSDIFVILYSITDSKSFCEAGRIAKIISGAVSMSEKAMLLVGTKNDLQHLRDVTQTEGQHLAKKMNCDFYEISISESYSDTVAMFSDALKKYLGAHPLALNVQATISSTLATPNGLRESSTNLAVPNSKAEKSSPKTLSIMNGIRTTFTRRKSISVL